jgi:hypothetical protein
MAQYIDKDAVITEMKRRISNLEQLGDRNFIETHFNEQFRFIEAYEGIIDFVNTLEVKEADLKNLREELDRVVKIYNPNGDFGWGTLYNIALHFFELGLKTQKGE